MVKRIKVYEAKKKVLRNNNVELTLDGEEYSRRRERYVHKIYTEFLNNRRDSIINSISDIVKAEEAGNTNEKH